MTRAESDPDPVRRLGPLAPDPGPAPTAEEAAEFAAYDNHVHSLQMADIDGRAKSDPNWAAPTWLTTRLLSDHPDARAERQRRREATYQADMARSRDILAWAVRVSAAPDATSAERDLAEMMAPSAARSAERAEASFAVPDADYVAKARTGWENFRRADDPDYRYPDRYIGATASSRPRPDPEPQLKAEP